MVGEAWGALTQWARVTLNETAPELVVVSAIIVITAVWFHIGRLP